MDRSHRTRATRPRSIEPRSILIVDDEPLVRRMLGRVLTSWGHRVADAPDARRGIERAHRTPFDLVLADLHLPDMSGLELLERLEAQLDPVPALVLISGELRSSWPRPCLEKPFDFERVRELLRHPPR